jgi:hypothetical protein
MPFLDKTGQSGITVVWVAGRVLNLRGKRLDSALSLMIPVSVKMIDEWICRKRSGSVSDTVRLMRKPRPDLFRRGPLIDAFRSARKVGTIITCYRPTIPDRTAYLVTSATECMPSGSSENILFSRFLSIRG